MAQTTVDIDGTDKWGRSRVPHKDHPIVNRFLKVGASGLPRGRTLETDSKEHTELASCPSHVIFVPVI